MHEFQGSVGGKKRRNKVIYLVDWETLYRGGNFEVGC